MENKTILRIEKLRKYFPVRTGKSLSFLRGKKEYVKAVDDISFNLNKGEILGLVGESGCGKSTLSRLILRLIEPTSGSVFIEDTNVSELNRKQLKKIRRKMQMIFQDPHGSLNPRQTIADTIRETIRIHQLAKDEIQENLLIDKTLEEVGLKPAESFRDRYPDLLSGGQKQRVSIGRVLVLKPQFLIADEPVSMLDVSVRIGILDLLLKLREKRGISMIFITHDMSTARHICDRIAIMYLGNIVEMGPTEKILAEPRHPYTKALVAAVPVTDPMVKVKELPIKGYIPLTTDEKSSCKFHPRCLFTKDACRNTKPELIEIETGHFVACSNI